MPGITGIIGGHSPQANRANLDRMVRRMTYEPFHQAGQFAEEKLRAWLGWVAHAGSFADGNPSWNETRDVCLIFGGENFADPADLENLKAKGHTFDANTASYLVHLYEEQGIRFLEKLNGWFCGVLIDLKEQKVVLFNDRYGFSRVYLHESGDGLYFASEAKAILAVVPETRELDMRGLGEFFACGCALQNRTIFSKITLLPGGSRWTFTPGQPVRKEFYFQKETWEAQPVLSEADFYEKLKATFSRVLPKYFSGRQGIGMSLTGGLDGRMIMAWADRQPGSLPCYTFGGSYRDCTDVVAARRIAKACGQTHTVIPVGDTFLAQFPKFAEGNAFVSDGAMDVTGAVELYINRFAREIAPTRMTGNYGSEIVRSHIMFRPHGLNDRLFSPDMLKLGGQAAATYRDEANMRRLSFIAFKQVPWHHRSRLSVEQSLVTMRSPYLDNELVALMYQAPDHVAVADDASLKLMGDGRANLGRIPTDRGLSYPPTPVLTKMRHLYQEFTVRAEYAYDYGMPKWVARVDHVFAPFHLERLFLGRHKFHHFRVWYRDKLAGYVREVLLDPRARQRPYLQGANLENLLDGHFKRGENHTVAIHQALSAELVQRQLVEVNAN
jgi:asparagine synthase (glutamine-hydrolysing)